ncbi:FMN-dependent NADH-azoreductase [Chromobacterium paludis]|uniref:FMN dependent NADH:quinone oxidoreductase n=1 Tax=Chromobacterium paludis TaxID=2605945 RepID=A0A5C1DF67_9NEIS|nr:NAD(P)H-dependent oxidoreductase [Chromobacterium paludis]QEL55422.1 FMN-dependent NADH-azoreductase [Chromobacterium paludis]
MSDILHISASPNGIHSYSRRIGDALALRLAAASAGRVAERDLSEMRSASINQAFVEASLSPADPRGPEQMAALALSEQLIGELERCTCLILSTPMHNFTVPASLKTWLDLVLRPGRTFRGGPDGKTGLLADRPVCLIVSSGGPLPSQPDWQADFLTPYLRYALACMGLRDVSVLYQENLRRGDEAWRRAQQEAAQWLDRQTARLTQARVC